MSDDFDLLETNSNEKTGKVDVNWGKAIDTMKSKLAQEDDPEVRQKILNATLDDVVGMAEKDRTTLLDAIKDLTDYQDEVGIIFEKFSSLNASEQKVIDDAQKALERAKIELEDAQNKPDTWWNNLWGRKSKIKKAEQDLVEAEKIRAAADNKAKAMFQERIETADVQTLLSELSFKSQAAVTRLKNREVEIKEVEDKLQDAIVEATKTHTKALEKKKEVEAKLEENYALLKQARQELEEIVDKQSADYAQAIGKVTTLEQKVQEFAAILEHLGVKTDEHIGETLAAMHTASAKARQEMMDNIPVHEKVMQGVYSSYAEALQEIRIKDADIQKNFAERYGIDMKEIFEDYYKAEANKPSGDDAGKPSGTPKPEAGADDLLS